MDTLWIYPLVSIHIRIHHLLPPPGDFQLFLFKKKDLRAPARQRARARLPMDTPWLSLSMDIHKERLGGVLESGAPT